MRFLSLLCLLAALGSPVALWAQEPSKSELHPCGTAPYMDPWLAAYLEQPDAFAANRSDDTLYVGLQIHLVGRDNGSGHFSPDRLLQAFCRLNADFAPSRIQFYFKYDWNYINKTEWFDHNEITQGIDMMFANNVSDALNIYFVADPAGNCGYNLPYAGIAMSHGCAGPNDHTWAHEIGHAFTIQHPFIGWEGTLYNFNNPTPDTLTYDYTHFHMYPDTIIPAPLDTALVEYLDGSNCTIAADKFCDTPPDYLAFRWDCDANGQSLVKMKDPAGNEFFADGTLFMSYSNDICANRFSDEQIAAMRANILSVKTGMLAPGPTAPEIIGAPEPLFPINGQTAPSISAQLTWSAAPGATHYLIQASRFSSYTLKEIDVVTTDTFFITGQLAPDRTYFWRILPFNNWSACQNFTANATFKTAAVSNAPEEQAGQWSCYPTLLEYGNNIFVEAPDHWSDQTASARLFRTDGALIQTENIRFFGRQSQVFIPDELASGVYRLVLNSNKETKYFNLQINR